jgi:hypothetical protein
MRAQRASGPRRYVRRGCFRKRRARRVLHVAVRSRGGGARRRREAAGVRCSPRASACGRARQRSVGAPAGGRSGGARSRCRREAAMRGGSACDAAHGLPHAAGRGNAAWASLREGAPAGPEADAGARRRREAAVRAMQPTGFSMQQGEAAQRGRPRGRALRRGPKQMQARGGDARRRRV